MLSELNAEQLLTAGAFVSFLIWDRVQIVRANKEDKASIVKSYNDLQERYDNVMELRVSELKESSKDTQESLKVLDAALSAVRKL